MKATFEIIKERDLLCHETGVYGVDTGRVEGILFVRRKTKNTVTLYNLLQKEEQTLSPEAFNARAYDIASSESEQSSDLNLSSDPDGNSD